MPRVALHTLGCKVNQYETQQIAEGFRSKGFDLVDFSREADVYVINTCTVTQVADSKSRQAARAAIHRNPDAMVVLTGCYAETSPEQVRGIDGVSLVVGNRDKAALVQQVMDLLGYRPGEETADREPRTPVGGRTRALLKVQDGCDQFCSYCAVPLARSVMSCKPLAEAVREGGNLAGSGYKEIVLTGIRLGLYRDGDADLVALLRALAKIPGIERIRLSSIELTDIPDGLLDLVSEDRKVCRHLHIPLQSGDDGVLARMNRPYTTGQFAAFVREARERVPGLSVTSDVIVGFPGETTEESQASHSFVDEMRFARAHVFRYSPRPGTAAAGMSDNVPAAEKDRRSRSLILLSERHAGEFALSLVGTVAPVLVEGKTIEGSVRSGLTDNYVRVYFEAGSDCVGKIVDVRVESVSGATARGRIVSDQ